MATNIGATGHFLLKPEEGDFSDIFKIIFYRHYKQSKFVAADKDRHAKAKAKAKPSRKASKHRFYLKWDVMISILLQKILLLMAKPLLVFRCCLRLLLLLVSTIRNGFWRVCYFLRGKPYVPDDKRVKFNFKHKGNAAFSVIASKSSYEKIDDIKAALEDTPEMEFVDSYGFSEDMGKATTDAFILIDRSKDRDTYLLTFRGTEMFNAHDWCTDVDISWYNYGDFIGNIHAGFLKALGLQNDGLWPEESPENLKKVAYYALRDMLKKALSENEKARLIITGHSLGGAMAVLFAATLIMHDETLLLERLDEVYTFGQPRVGDETFAKYMKQMLKKHDIGYYRTVYGYDIVPRLPFDLNKETYKHFGICIYYYGHRKYKIVEQEPLKNYFSILMAIPKRIHALFELIGSLTTGDEYEAGAVASYMVGLVFPGVAAHSVNGYVSAISRSFPSPHELSKADRSISRTML